jgi:hypothetical protein
MQLNVAAEDMQGVSSAAAGAKRSDNTGLAGAASLTSTLIQRKKTPARPVEPVPMPAAAVTPSRAAVAPAAPVAAIVPPPQVVAPAQMVPPTPVVASTHVVTPAQAAAAMHAAAVAQAAAAVQSAAAMQAAPSMPRPDMASAARSRTPRPIDPDRIYTVRGAAPASAGAEQSIFGDVALFVSVFVASCAVILFAYLNTT